MYISSVQWQYTVLSKSFLGNTKHCLLGFLTPQLNEEANTSTPQTTKYIRDNNNTDYMENSNKKSPGAQKKILLYDIENDGDQY